MKRRQKIRLLEKQLARTAYELGRYRKKVEDQHKELDRLRGEISGYQQIAELSYALVTAAVLHTGELTITKEELRHITREGRRAVVIYGDTGYTLRMEVGEDGTG